MTARPPADEVDLHDHEVDLHHHGDDDLDPGHAGQLNLAVNVRLPRPPDWLRARLHDALDGLAAYPRKRDAIAAVAARHGRPADEVLLTNGADEAFTLIATALGPRRAACLHPSYTEPEAVLRQAGHEVTRVILPPPFTLTEVPDDADLVVLGNPTNPTAVLHPAQMLERLARPGRILIVDEAFADAVPGEPASLSTRRDLPGLLVVRSLTKTWGLAGLRVGYVLGDPDTLAALGRAQPHWPVNSLALTALEACSQPAAVSWARDQASRMAGWRSDLARALDALPGVAVAPGGQAPFLLLRVAGHPAVRQRLLEQGIAIRRGDTFPGLGPDWLRIAVAAPEHHQRIVAAFAASIVPATTTTRATTAPTATVQPPSLPNPSSPNPSSPSKPVTTGTVTLIGAGPGGADLITLRGWHALHAADVVVADRLADPRLTGELRPGVLLIDAGKAPGTQQLSQDQINRLLVEHARAGRHVARLKGGDPFVFGRGGEEAVACAAAGLPCTVIPGLSSVTAGPALAGIPLTHRDLGQSFCVVSGHLPPGHPGSRVNWTALAAGPDTLVLLMAVRNLPAIAARLIADGRLGTTPAASIERAGTARQRVHRGTLAEFARPDQAPGISNPAVIVIGPTARDLTRG